MKFDIRVDIATGRPTVLTDEGSLIDVQEFIAAVWEQQPSLVTQGIYMTYGSQPQAQVQQ